MKNIQFLFYLFLVSSMLHGIDEKQAAIIQRSNSWDDIDYGPVQKQVEDKLAHYLIDCHKSYNKLFTTKLSSQETDQIEEMQMDITNKKDSPHLGILAHKHITDDRGYTVLHSAIEKGDVHGLKWSLGILSHPICTLNNDGKGPFHLCIDPLMDTNAKVDYQQCVYNMFDILTARYSEIGFDRDSRMNFLIEMMQVNLEHIKENSPFRLKDVFFTRFLAPRPAEQEDISLAEVYQKARDKDGNSFTYVVVCRALSRMLYSFAQNGYLTFTKSDNDKCPVELKLAKELRDFCDLTHNSGTSSESSKEVQSRRCCYRILLNSLKQQRNDTDFEYCCNDHSFPLKNK